MACFKYRVLALSSVLVLSSALATPTFDIMKRYSAVDLRNSPPPVVCAQEVQPEPVKGAEQYYQIAYKLWGEQETGLYPQMYALGGKAAQMGDWRAKLLMAQLYNIAPVKKYGTIEYTEFNPQKARSYIDELMQQGVPAAFYFMGLWRNAGKEGFKDSPSPASVYLNQAIQLGYAPAEMYMADLRLTQKKGKEAQQFIACAAQHGSGRALNLLSLAGNIKAKSHTDWVQAFRYLHQSAQAGYHTSFADFAQYNDDYKQAMGRDYLSPDFLARVELFHQAVRPNFFHQDPYRKKQGLYDKKKNNILWKFPRLDKVLPLPPAVLPPWNGDISQALSESDARYYREDYTIPRLNAILRAAE